jgi:exonuclease VII large subunit
MTILLLCLALLTCEAALAEKPVDLDLTVLSGTVVYSQVYDMMMEPERYMGMQVRMKGSFSYFQDPDTMKEYFAVVIADATACCAQGIEFVWDSHKYPEDYPTLGTELTVTGAFSIYEENGFTYLQLKDAEVSWT